MVADDGTGFDVRVALDVRTAPLHLGLDSTAERLRLAGGDLAIESELGSGTVVRITIPLDPA
jgi:signal transduction histidine kinase